MRTTLTLEDDVARELGRLQREREASFEQVVNVALRAGLMVLRGEVAEAPRAYSTEPADLGRARLPDLDDVAGVLEIADSEG
ncbi:MAG: CopG family transcriptional regulator [Acidobacteria bacterium]|nr:MAG: CopG family transcriptional regulator [Acidobacteriota bacterium]